MPVINEASISGTAGEDGTDTQGAHQEAPSQTGLLATVRDGVSSAACARAASIPDELQGMDGGETMPRPSAQATLTAAALRPLAETLPRVGAAPYMCPGRCMHGNANHISACM